MSLIEKFDELTSGPAKPASATGLKRPEDSNFVTVLPFGSDAKLRDEYKNPFGDLRIGKILEDLDVTAGIVSYTHADGHALGLGIVTAACDRIDLLAPLRGDCDLRIMARVNWVGRSSMEVGIRLESMVAGEFRLVARAYFIMVARRGAEAAEINRLELAGPEERRRAEEAALRQEQRRRHAAVSYHKAPPSEEEIRTLHQLFLDARAGRASGVEMAATSHESVVLMHFQDRNVHHKIFGGYIMRQCFELAFNTACLFSRRRPFFVAVDHVYFVKPVEIGSIVTFKSTVVYTGSTSFLVEVVAEVNRPLDGTRDLTNVCFFTFVAVDDAGRPLEIPKVLPQTYEEGLKYLDGAKRYRYGKAVRLQKGGESLFPN